MFLTTFYTGDHELNSSTSSKSMPAIFQREHRSLAKYVPQNTITKQAAISPVSVNGLLYKLLEAHISAVTVLHCSFAN